MSTTVPPPQGKPLDRATRRANSAAGSFKYNAQFEKASELRHLDPAAFAKLPTLTKIGLGDYQLLKAAASAAGIDVTNQGEVKPL